MSDELHELSTEDHLLQYLLRHCGTWNPYDEKKIMWPDWTRPHGEWERHIPRTLSDVWETLPFSVRAACCIVAKEAGKSIAELSRDNAEQT
jgi:hypothetical protein